MTQERRNHLLKCKHDLIQARQRCHAKVEELMRCMLRTTYVEAQLDAELGIAAGERSLELRPSAQRIPEPKQKRRPRLTKKATPDWMRDAGVSL